MARDKTPKPDRSDHALGAKGAEDQMKRAAERSPVSAIDDPAVGDDRLPCDIVGIRPGEV